jgi:ribonucleoside-diphosphate reductase alpha chain
MSQAPNKPQQKTLREFEPAIRPPAQIRISQNSRQVLRKRYLRKGLDGEPVEDIDGMFRRVASAVAEPDSSYGYDVATTEESFYALLADLRFFPNSPTFTGAATPLGQLAACFVLPISDDLGKRPDGIFQTLRDAALIQQTGGGNGFSFSRLRPEGDSVASSAGVASGPVGFLRVYDTAFGEVAQGGTRRGANMAVLRVDHPDIEEFIACKESEGQITNFNISVGITDAFMKAVEADGDFDLVSPRDGAVSRTVRARELFETIVTFAHHNGEPGALFLDAANRSNPVPHLYELEATNPCGEQWLGPYENCCLGSVNLAQHVTDDGRVNWDKLKDSVMASTRFLDNVVDANKYVPAVPQLKEAAMRARRIGLGIMGLGDLMYALGVRYGSTEGQEFAAQVMEFVRYHCMRTSIDLARERGPFPAIPGSIYDPVALKWKPPSPMSPYCHEWDRPPVDWGEITSGIRAHGIRNAAQTTVAPTGTIGTVAGCEGYGCEPVFALAYTRTVKDGDRDLKLTYTSPLFEAALQRVGLDGKTRREIAEHITSTGSCQSVTQVPEAIRGVFVVSQDITAEEHVRMQAAIQAFVDNSISKTINFPEGASVEDVAQAYRLAWRLGCKGLTVYVTGSRHEVVLETRATKDQKSRRTQETPAATDNGEESGAAEEPRVGGGTLSPRSSLSASFPPGHPTKRPRPAALRGVTYRKETPLGTAFVTVNINGGEYPFEVFLNVGKAGSDVAAVSEALGRLISLVLRLPSPLNPSERFKQVIDQLAGIGGGRSPSSRLKAAGSVTLAATASADRAKGRRSRPVPTRTGT